MNVLDVSGMLNVDRFRKIDVHATKPEEVYSSTGAMAPGCNLEFLTQCARSMAMLNFAERDSGRVYARFEHGTLKGVCPELLERALKDPDTRTAVLALAPHALEAGTHR